MQDSFRETRLYEKERRETQSDTLLRDGTRLVSHKESEPHAPAAKIVLLRRAKCRLVSQIITRIYLAERTSQGDELSFATVYARREIPGNVIIGTVRSVFCRALLSLMKYASSKSLEGGREGGSRYHHYYRL